MPSDILNSLQKSMLLNPVKKEQKGYFRKKTEQQNGTAANISTKTQVGGDRNEHIRVQ